MDNEILLLLSNSYESSNENRKSSLIRLFQYIEQDLNQVLESLIIILQNQDEIKIKFLSLALIRYIYEYYNQEHIEILIQNSETFIEICHSFFQSEIATQSGATMAEIVIFLSSFDINVSQIIQPLINGLQPDIIKAGIFEFFSIICAEIDIDSGVYLSIINFITDPQFLNQSNQNDIINGIQLLSCIILENSFLIGSNILTNIVNFLLSALLTFDYKSVVYLCFANLVKKCFHFQQMTLNQVFFDELIDDLSNDTFIPEICYFLRKSIKNNYIIGVDIELGLCEKYDNDSIAFSVIEQFIFTLKNGSLPAVRPYLIFDSEVFQVREIGFKVLNSIIAVCSFKEQEYFDFLEEIFIHICDISARVREAALWALHAFCYKKVLPLENVKSFYEKEDSNLFETLLTYLNEIEDNNSSTFAAISCEILSLFAIQNIDDCFQSIFEVFFQFIFELNADQLSSDPNLYFAQIRIEKVLLNICSHSFEQTHLIHFIISTSSTLLDQVLQSDPSQSEYLSDFHDFLCELIDKFFQNNILYLTSFDIENNQDLIQSLIAELTELNTENSISALTSLFISLGESISSELTVLFEAFESFPNESINSIIRYSIKQSDYSLLEEVWEVIQDKHSLFFAPLIEHVKNETVSLNESHIESFDRLFDPLFLNDYLILLEIIISNSETADEWIDFGFGILNSLKNSESPNIDDDQKIEEIFQENLELIILFFQSAIASSIQLCRSLITDYDFMYIINYALTDPDVSSETESILIALDEIE